MIHDFYEQCTKTAKISVSDGLGGMVDTFTDGDVFPAAIALNSENEGAVGEKKSLVKSYNILIPDDVDLFQNDLIKRKNGEVLRIVSNADDNKVPHFSMLDVKCVQAEVIE